MRRYFRYRNPQDPTKIVTVTDEDIFENWWESWYASQETKKIDDTTFEQCLIDFCVKHNAAEVTGHILNKKK